jgi:GTPase SAR1 family protein
MRRFLTYVGMYAIASVIGASALTLHDYVMNVINSDFKTSWMLFVIVYLCSLPFAYIGQGWLYRFGFVKGMVAIHLMLWLGVMAFVNVLELVGYGRLFTNIPSYVFTLLLYLLPITLGAIIMNWLIYGTQGLSQFKKKLMVRARPPKTLDFADYGKWVVVGQNHVIDAIQKVLIANTRLADRGDPKRERILASFLFVGPTGVGKTETAKALADWLRQEGYDFLRIDANQFADREALWTLLGAAKGYIGSETPGLLPHAISQNPKQVILIDEIEKAEQGFYQPLLQLLDEGYVIERSTGYAYYLNRAIVIITSNLENQKIAEIMETLSNPIEIDIAVRKTLEGAVVLLNNYKSFKITPEFLGRIDAVVPFRSLGFEDLVEIAYRELRRLGENVDIDFARALTQKYYPIAREYGVRYFIKKITEEVLSQ